MDNFDVIIKDATIVEGTGKKAYKGSIGIKNDKIVSLGDIEGEFERIIDAEGLVAFPGFIDAHSHADWNLLWYPKCESYVMQGVTTFIGGQCGGSPAPLGEYVRVPRMLGDHLFDLDPYKYYPQKSLYPLDQVNEWMKEFYGWTLDWKTMGDFFNKVEDMGISSNFAPLVGHGTIRTKVMGLDHQRHSTKKEQAMMRELIVEALEEGCIGMSAGMDYDDYWASEEEIIDGVKVLKKYDAVYCPHALLTGRRRDWTFGHMLNEKITGFMKQVEVYKHTGVRLHIAHLANGWDTFPGPTERLEAAIFKETIEMVTKDSKKDLDITYDTMPVFVRGGYDMQTYLCSLLEPWLRELGGRKALGKWLKLREYREEIKEAIRQGKWYIRWYTSPNINPRWAENIYVVKSKSSGLDGKSIAEIAEERGVDQWDTWFDIISEDPDTRAVTDFMVRSKESIRVLYSNPLSSVGLDVSLYDDKYQPKNPPYRIPGILTYSGFPLFVKTVLENGILTLEETVQKTSVMTAKAHNLKGRGILSEGYYADIVLLDLPNIKVLGDELESRTYPEGVEYVFVNGVVAKENGKHTGSRPGKIIKRMG